MSSEWTAEPTCNLYSAHGCSWGATEHLLSDASANRLSCLLFVLLESGGYPGAIIHTTCIRSPSHFHCSASIGLQALHYGPVLHPPVGLLSPITQHWDMVQPLLHFHGVQCFSVLSQAAYGDPSLGLTPLINSARCSAQLHTFDWLGRGLETSSDWLRWVLH